LAIGAISISAVGLLFAADKPDDAALARTRKQVKMLDDVYKTAIVLITDKYVNKADDFGAGPLAVKWFDAIKKNGWHEVRLVDATGEPLEDKNAPQDAFEKAAIKALKSGKASHDEVVTREGKTYLRAATIIPVVSKKCTMCHPNYEKAKAGEAIGALMYTLPVE
jgi:hypothetical protein